MVSEGIRLEFLERPPLAESLILFNRNAKREAELCYHVEEMVSKEALDLSPLLSPGFYSNLFLVPKKLGHLKPVINLKPLNLFIKTEKFKMETIRSIRKALFPGDWVTSIDLKDTYFHILVHPEFRKYLRIVIGGKVFQFKALPLGLSPATREFCWVTGVMGTLLHKLTIYLHLYLDDWLLRAMSRAICLAHTQLALVNWAKSELVPTQRFVFLGEAYDLVVGLVRPSQEAVTKVLALCRVLRRQPLQTACFLRRLLGVLNSVADIIPYGRLHTRPLQLFLIAQ